MNILFLIVAAIAGLVGLWVLHGRYGFRAADFISLGVLGSVCVFLSRYDTGLTVDFLGRPYPGILVFLAVASLVLTLFRSQLVRGPALDTLPVWVLAGVFCYLSLLSGLVNGGWSGVGAAVQAILFVMLPMVVAFQVVCVLPRDRLGADRLRRGLILLGGVLTPVSLLATSLLAPILAQWFGWQLRIGVQSDTMRGWSPLGGSIATGLVMVLAFGLAMHEVVGLGRRRYAMVLFLVSIAVLFTLSRSSVLMLLVFTVAYFWRTIRRRPEAAIATLVAASVIGFGSIYLLEKRYDFSRLTMTRGQSIEVRSDSAVAGVLTSLGSPLLGAGPGLLYEDIRTVWLEKREPAPYVVDHERTFLLENRLSAQEPHNMYVYLMAEHGWIATVVFVLMMWAFYRRTSPPERASAEDESLFVALRALGIALFLMMLTHSGPLVNPKIATIIWTLGFYGMLTQITHRAARARTWSLRALPAGR